MLRMEFKLNQLNSLIFVTRSKVENIDDDEKKKCNIKFPQVNTIDLAFNRASRALASRAIEK